MDVRLGPRALSHYARDLDATLKPSAHFYTRRNNTSAPLRTLSSGSQITQRQPHSTIRGPQSLSLIAARTPKRAVG